MIQANQDLFGLLASAGGELITPDLRRQKRAVRTTDDEKGWLQNVTLRASSHLVVDSSSKFAIAEYGQDFYLITIGVVVESAPPELEPVEVNAGLFTAIAQELDVPLVRTPDLGRRLLEYVFYPVETGCELIDREILAPFFQRLSLFRIDRTSAIASDTEFALRAAIAAVLGAPASRPLNWPAEALERLGYMVRDPNERAPFHLLLRALTATRDDSAFLSLYRCIEQLFPIPSIGSLSTELGLTQPALAVAKAIERHLGWRRREEDAIAQLFSQLDTGLIGRLIPAAGVVAPVDAQSHARATSRRIYDLRNHCVHFRPAHAAGDALNVDDWPALINLMLQAVQSLYAQYTSAFEA